MRLQLRGTPGLGRILALPAGLLAAAAVANGLAWAVFPPSRWLHVAAVSFAIFGCYQLVRSVRVLVARRRLADNWLRCASGSTVPSAYAWRAEQLCSPRHRRTLAGALRSIVESAHERPVGRRRPMYLPAVRKHRESVLLLARALEQVDEPVTPAGMLRVVDLTCDGRSPLWASSEGELLGEAISTTLAVLQPGSHAEPDVAAAA